MQKILSGLLLAMLAAFGGLTLARAAPNPPAAPAPTPADTTPVDPGLALIQDRCVGCHSMGFILQRRRSAEDWRDVVSEMANRGADISESEAGQIQAYLEKTMSIPQQRP